MAETPPFRPIGPTFPQRVRRRLSRMLGLAPPAAPALKNQRVWSIGIYAGSSPLTLAPDPRFPGPVLTRDDVTDVSCGFVADPFLVRASATWHMFFESYDRKTRLGEIALATSGDLAAWRYEQVVLREPFHLSYPFVFEWEGAHYMVPETHQTSTIRLYRADDFPRRWSLVHTLLSGRRFADTTLFRHDGRWWLYTETSDARKHDTLRLYHADDLLGAWTEHPASPLVEGDPQIARPAGRVVAASGRLLRFAQGCVPRYGITVNARSVDELTPTTYRESPALAGPLLSGSGTGWNETGMHHVDAHEVFPGQWIAAVDGWYSATAAQVAGAP